MAKIFLFPGISNEENFSYNKELAFRRGLQNRGVLDEDLIVVDYQSVLNRAAHDILDIETGPRGLGKGYPPLDSLTGDLIHLRAKTERDILVLLLSDALFWMGRAEKKAILQHCSERIASHLRPKEPAILFGHSLGSVIAVALANEIHRGDVDKVPPSHLNLAQVTLSGSPVRIFARTVTREPWKHFHINPPPTYPTINWIDPRDPVAWPLSKWLPDVRDSVVDNGSLWRCLFPISKRIAYHTGYWYREAIHDQVSRVYLKVVNAE